MHLIDSSVWIDYFSPRTQVPPLAELWDRVDSLIATGEAAVTGMVRLEVLGGARNERDYQQLEQALRGLVALPVTDVTWEQAAAIAFRLRRRGLTVPFTDALIASVALQAEAVLLHRDRHFDTIAAHFPLRVESHV